MITGPSAVGKGTIVKELQKQSPDVGFSCSVTTRPPRPGETDGVEYFFVSKEEFERKLEAGELLEWAEVYSGHYYGTLRSQVEEITAGGKDLILDIDINGARQVREKYSEGVFIFVIPPALKTLEERIRRRGTESDDAIAHRLAQVPIWLAEGLTYQYVLVNDQLQSAVDQLKAILIAEKRRTERNGFRLIRALLEKGEL